MNSSGLKLAALLVVLALGVVGVIRGARPSRPPLDKSLHATVGRVFASEAASRLGQTPVVIVKPEADFKMPLVEAQYRAFKETAKSRGVKIEAEEAIRLKDVGPLDGLLTASLYSDLCRKYPSAGAFVSFVGLGDFLDKELADARTPIYVIAISAGLPKKYFDKKLVRLAIMRQGVVAPETLGVSGEDEFSKAYQVAIPAGGGRG